MRLMTILVMIVLLLGCTSKNTINSRSEERRVGKEC